MLDEDGYDPRTLSAGAESLLHLRSDIFDLSPPFHGNL
jgi:hypothetical protein